MPKKPFTAEEVTAQCQRIMDSAATVTASVGFHHLSMRKMALELGMTASNIYNYFPNKERLFLQTRQRGFELLLTSMKHDMGKKAESAHSSTASLHGFAHHLIAFAQRFPGYYQLMFQPPTLANAIDHDEDQRIAWQIERSMNEWQAHVFALLLDALPQWRSMPEGQQQRAVLFLVSSLHGLIDTYRHGAMTQLLQDVELIPQDVIAEHVAWLLQGLQQVLSVSST